MREDANKIRALFQGDLYKSWLKTHNLTGDDVKNLSDDDALNMCETFRTQVTDYAKDVLGMSYEERRSLNGNRDGIADLFHKYSEYLDNLNNNEDVVAEPAAESNEVAEPVEELERAREEMARELVGVDLQDFLDNDGLTLGEIRNMSIDELEGLRERMRLQMMRSLGSEVLLSYLDRDNVRMGDLRNASFDEIRQIREGYRVELMREFCDVQYTDMLDARNVKVGDLRRMSLENLIGLMNSLQNPVEAEPQEEATETAEAQEEAIEEPIPIIDNHDCEK